MVNIRCANQSEISFIGNCENDATIFPLEKIAFVMIVKLAGYDVTAPHQAHPFFGVKAGGVANDVFNPGPSGVDQNLRPHNPARAAVLVLQCDMPDAVYHLGHRDFGSGGDARAALCCIAGI